jgi:exodeoxyribonuclease VII large subunit
LVRDDKGQPVRSAAAIAAGARFQVELADGRISAVAEGGGEAPAKKPARKSLPGGQGDLF